MSPVKRQLVWLTQGIPAHVPEQIGCGNSKGRRVEPLVPIVRHAGERVADLVRPGTHVGIQARVADARVERQSAVIARDAGPLPTADNAVEYAGRVGCPSLAFAEGQAHNMADGNREGAVENGQPMIELRVVLVGWGTEFAEVQGLRPGQSSDQG